jgi:hypothetical protein
MFGPDYLVAPVLTKGAASRFVYLPPLPAGFVWKNVFTAVETDSSAGGMNIRYVCCSLQAARATLQNVRATVSVRLGLGDSGTFVARRRG